MTTRNRLALLAALSLTVGFSGCGGDGARPDSGTPGAPDSAIPDSAEPPVGTASLTVSTASVDLGTFDVGRPSAPALVTVTNTGTATSGRLTLVVTGDWVVANGCEGATLDPQTACTITIIARSPVVGSISGTVEVGDSPANSQKITVTGDALGESLSFNPTILDFGRVPMGKTVSETIVITYSGAVDLRGLVINVSGTGFALSPASTCTDMIPPGQCNVVVTFTGLTTGVAKGTVSFSQGGVTKPVPMTATVPTIGQWNLTPRSASLQTMVGTPSSPVTFFVDRGDGSGPIPTATITGTNARDFSFTTDCDKPLVGNAPYSCQVNVVYNPATSPATNSTATLTVVAGDLVATATLTGTAVNCGSGGGIQSTHSDFGSVVVGSTSSELSFTIANHGASSSGAIEVSAHPSQFVIATDTCTGKELAGGTECTFTVVFTPAAGDIGFIQGYLKATLGTGPCSTHSVFITGNAIPSAKLAISPPVLEFGAIPTLQESQPLTLIVSNVGGTPTGALKVDNTGAQFKIKGDTCSGATLTAAGVSSSCTIALTYTPAAQPAEATGSITISDTTGAAADPVTATIHGTGEPHPTLLRQTQRGYR